MDIFKVPALQLRALNSKNTKKMHDLHQYKGCYQFNIHYVHSNTVGEHCSNINDKCNIILGVSC